MATRRQIALFEVYSPEWTDVLVNYQADEVPTIEEVQQTLNGGVSKDLSFSEWLQSQRPSYQRQFFGTTAAGTAKYEAWKRGDIIVTRLPLQSPISMATLQRRNAPRDARVLSATPIVDPSGTSLPRRAQARLRANAVNAPEYNGNKLLKPSDIPSYNFDALSSFLHSLTPSQLEEVLPRTVLRNWRENPTAGGLRYGNGQRVSFENTIRKLIPLFENVSI